MSRAKNMSRKIALGITGSFGSGCSTISNLLVDSFGFKKYSLSDALKDEYNNAKGDPTAAGIYYTVDSC
jgi:dephospho-CoA kinase